MCDSCCCLHRNPLGGLRSPRDAGGTSPGGATWSDASVQTNLNLAFVGKSWVPAAVPLPVERFDEPDDASRSEVLLADHRNSCGVSGLQCIFEEQPCGVDEDLEE